MSNSDPSQSICNKFGLIPSSFKSATILFNEIVSTLKVSPSVEYIDAPELRPSPANLIYRYPSLSDTALLTKWILPARSGFKLIFLDAISYTGGTGS